jgi:hypothetical protein
MAYKRDDAARVARARLESKAKEYEALFDAEIEKNINARLVTTIGRNMIPTDEQVEVASKAYAEATGYYVPFHRGLSSPSSDKIREGMRAALTEVFLREMK